MPAPNLMAALNAPIARMFARQVDASEQQLRSDLAELPTLLERVDSLIAAGTIGRDEPNAADFQIGTSIRVLLAFEDLSPMIADRPAADLAMRILPTYPATIPPVLPPEWLPAPD
jgi:glutathione S-transferase